jgi:hypothetical protein
MWKRLAPLAQADTRKTFGCLAVLVLAGFAVYQLYCAVFLGVVLTGPKSHSAYMSFQEHPYYFVFGVVLWTVLILFGIGLVAAAAWFDSRWRRRSNRDFIAPTEYRENPPH